MNGWDTWVLAAPWHGVKALNSSPLAGDSLASFPANLPGIYLKDSTKRLFETDAEEPCALITKRMSLESLKVTICSMDRLAVKVLLFGSNPGKQK
jgi:hypothetical protein